MESIVRSAEMDLFKGGGIRQQMNVKQNFKDGKAQKKENSQSEKGTEDDTLFLQLESKVSKDETINRQEPIIKLHNIQGEDILQNQRKYQKMMIKALPTTHPPIPDQQTNSKLTILDLEHQSLSSDSPPTSTRNITYKQQKHNRQTNLLRLSKPSTIEEKKFSLQLCGQEDFLLCGTDSVVVNSLNSQEQSVTHEYTYPKHTCSNNDYRRGPQTNKEYFFNKQKSSIVHPRGDQSHFQAKSQKKVTFIGDSSIIRTEEDIDQKPQIKENSETIVPIKDNVSMTSILHHRPTQTKSIALHSSRKIISQDGNYCLFRLIGSGKPQKLLMCRSVQIKDELTEYRQLKLYLLSRQNEHRNIVKAHSYDKSVRENKCFVEIKMDYYPKNLEQYILQGKRNDKRAKIQRKIILFQILKALNFMHSKNIYHRDLNHHSIMISDHLQVAITNFAYVKQNSNPFSSDHFYECNFYIRPPEVILQPSRCFQSGGDIWAFGCIVVYMLKGQMPFFKAADAELMLEIIKLLGPPSAKYLQSISFQEHKRFIFPNTYRKSMRSMFGCDEIELLQLLKSIFRYEPRKRATAAELMASHYFWELRDQSIFSMLNKTYDIQDLFAFKKNELSKEDLKRVVPKWHDSVS